MPNNFITRYEAADLGPADPYFEYVTALLSMNSFPFADAKGHVVDSINSSLTTVNSQYDGSATFNGADSAIRITPDAGLVMGTGDFTQEIRLRIGAYPASQGILFTNAPAGGTEHANTAIGINLMAAGNVRVQSSYAVFITGSLVVPRNADLHLAISKSNGVLRLFVNGVLDGSVASAHNFSTVSPIMIGKETFNANNIGQTLLGQVDEYRVTKSVGRYVNNFTVPPAFPTH